MKNQKVERPNHPLRLRWLAINDALLLLLAFAAYRAEQGLAALLLVGLAALGTAVVLWPWRANEISDS